MKVELWWVDVEIFIKEFRISRLMEKFLIKLEHIKSSRKFDARESTEKVPWGASKRLWTMMICALMENVWLFEGFLVFPTHLLTSFYYIWPVIIVLFVISLGFYSTVSNHFLERIFIQTCSLSYQRNWWKYNSKAFPSVHDEQQEGNEAWKQHKLFFFQPSQSFFALTSLSAVAMREKHVLLVSSNRSRQVFIFISKHVIFD